MGISKYSNSIKEQCIDNGVVDFVKQTLKDIYHNEDGELLVNFHECLARDKFVDCSYRLIESGYRKYSRARKHIEDIVKSGNAIFITLTFTDDVISKTSALTRRRYVSRYLSSQCDCYVANVDFSPKKHREHYHAVVDKRVDMSKWLYGFVWTEVVRTQDQDCKRVARYVAKLTSHAFKIDCSRLLYSRNVV